MNFRYSLIVAMLLISFSCSQHLENDTKTLQNPTSESSNHDFLPFSVLNVIQNTASFTVYNFCSLLDCSDTSHEIYNYCTTVTNVPLKAMLAMEQKDTFANVAFGDSLIKILKHEQGSLDMDEHNNQLVIQPLNSDITLSLYSNGFLLNDSVYYNTNTLTKMICDYFPDLIAIINKNSDRYIFIKE